MPMIAQIQVAIPDPEDALVRAQSHVPYSESIPDVALNGGGDGGAALAQGKPQRGQRAKVAMMRPDQCVLGIWDGYLDLRDHWHLPALSLARRLDLASGITDESVLAALDEALYVAVAVRARQSAVVVRRGPAPARPEQGSLDEELHHLLRVATFYRQPRVQAVAQRVLAGRLDQCLA